jgi:translation initiation factor IF-3
MMQKFCADLEDAAIVEAPAKMMGRLLIAVLAPGGKKKKETAVAPKAAPVAESVEQPPAKQE